MSLRPTSFRRPGTVRLLVRSTALIAAVALVGTTGVLGASAAPEESMSIPASGSTAMPSPTASATTVTETPAAPSAGIATDVPEAAVASTPASTSAATAVPSPVGVVAQPDTTPVSGITSSATSAQLPIPASSTAGTPSASTTTSPKAGVNDVRRLAAGAPVPAASSSSGTFTITGTLQADARDGSTVLPYVSVGKTQDWVPATKPVAVNAKTGVFTVTLPAGPAHYTLYFQTGHVPYFSASMSGGPSLSWTNDGDGTFTGKKGDVLQMGQMPLVGAGVIEGTVTDSTGAAVANAVVTASSRTNNQSQELTAETEAGGAYYLKVNRGSNYDVSVSGDSYQQTWYPAAEDDAMSKPVPVRSANSFHATGIDVTVNLTRPSVSGYFEEYDDENEDDLTHGPFTGPTDVQVSIYKLVDGAVSSIPVQSGYAGSDFEFEDLEPGDYALSFRDGHTNSWVPALYNTLTPQVGSLRPGGSIAGDGCLVPLTLVRGQAVDLGFFRMGDTATSTCRAPWGAGADFSGSVTGWKKGDATDAVLYYATSDGDAIEVDRAALSSAGTYSFHSITQAGRYFVGVVAGEAAPYFDTAQGGIPYDEAEFRGERWLDRPSSLYAEIARTPVTAEHTASPGNDVTLIGAVLLRGAVTSHSKPVPYAFVSAAVGRAATEELDQEATSADEAGRYLLKLHPGAGLILSASAGGYYTRYFPNTEDAKKATPVDFLSPGADKRTFNFSLRPTVTSLIGTVSPYPLDTLVAGGDPDPLKGMTATLFLKSGATWKKIGSSASTLVPAAGYRVSFPLAGASLAAGDYHLRFSIGSRWLPITGYRSEDDPDIVDGPVCAVPVTLEEGTPMLLSVAVDFYAETTQKCTDEPTPASTTGAASSGSSSAPTSSHASIPSLTDADTIVTGAPGTTAAPSAPGSPTPTARPTSAPTPTAATTGAPAVAAPTSAAAAGSLSWVILVGGIVLAVIVAGLVVMVVRRQSAAGR